jgi:hypothetical protein
MTKKNASLSIFCVNGFPVVRGLYNDYFALVCTRRAVVFVGFSFRRREKPSLTKLNYNNMKIKLFLPPEIMAELTKPEGFVFNDDDGLFIIMNDDLQTASNECDEFALSNESGEPDLYVDVLHYRSRKGSDVHGACVFEEDEKYHHPILDIVKNFGIDRSNINIVTGDGDDY